MKAVLCALLVLAALALSADATGALRRTRVRHSLAALKRNGNVLTDTDTEFAAIEKTLTAELSSVADDSKAERAFYNKMTKQIPSLVSGALKLADNALVGDAIKAVADAPLEKAAKLSFRIRHWLRVNVRLHQSKRVCGWILAWIVRARDKIVYGSTEGPDWPFVVKKAGGDAKADKVLPTGVSIGIIQGAQSTNKAVNKLMDVKDDTSPKDKPTMAKIPSELKLPSNPDTQKMIDAVKPDKPTTIAKDESCSLSDNILATHYMTQLGSGNPIDSIGEYDSQNPDGNDDSKLRTFF